MDDPHIWNQRCQKLVVANDRRRSTILDMEITRSLGDVLIARLLGRDRDSDRARTATGLAGEPMVRCDDHPGRKAVGLQPATRVKQ